MPFAVVDCETTGLFPGAHHRIIELAIVTADSADGPWDEWSTLLNPERDLGPTHIHGIRARNVRDAPRFQDVVGTVFDRLRGRVIVAHNARFDCAFLKAEFARAGFRVEPSPRLCTIEMASKLGWSGRSDLAARCQAAGIAVDRQHEALSDARLCAELLRVYIAWAEELGLSTLDDCGCKGTHADWPYTTDTAEPFPRELAAPHLVADSFLSRLVSSRPNLDRADGTTTAYAELLDRALEDRRLSEEESRELVAVAELYDLTGPQLARVHSAYMDALCATALADHVVTNRERYDLELVAEVLGISDLDRRLERASAAAEQAAVPDRPTRGRAMADLAGQSVCFTGKLCCTYEGEPLTRERACELAERAGMLVQPRVTKRLDILVVADPETNSRKAQLAREYGTRVIAETEFWPAIGVEVE